MYTASYDPVGNRVGVEELDGGFAYAYDPSRQLVGEVRAGTGAYACTFTYDGVGNRLTQMQADGTLTTYTYNPASELLTSQVGEAVTTFSYDPVGNTVGEQTPASETNFTWDAENRLVEVDDGETVETSAYDATGLRRQKTAGEATTHFVWDRVNLLAELDDTLARLAQYTDYPGVWGGLSSQRRGAASSYYAFDLSANTRALFNGGGITDQYLYEAFGVEQIVTGSTVNPLRFGGQVGYFREGAERVYVRARWYEAGVGRWVSRDPIGILASGETGPYAYVGAMSVRRVDPSGLQGRRRPDPPMPPGDQLKPILTACMIYRDPERGLVVQAPWSNDCCASVGVVWEHILTAIPGGALFMPAVHGCGNDCADKWSDDNDGAWRERRPTLEEFLRRWAKCVGTACKALGVEWATHVMIDLLLRALEDVHEAHNRVAAFHVRHGHAGSRGSVGATTAGEPGAGGLLRCDALVEPTCGQPSN